MGDEIRTNPGGGPSWLASQQGTPADSWLFSLVTRVLTCLDCADNASLVQACSVRASRVLEPSPWLRTDSPLLAGDSLRAAATQARADLHSSAHAALATTTSSASQQKPLGSLRLLDLDNDYCRASAPPSTLVSGRIGCQCGRRLSGGGRTQQVRRAWSYARPRCAYFSSPALLQKVADVSRLQLALAVLHSGRQLRKDTAREEGKLWLGEESVSLASRRQRSSLRLPGVQQKFTRA